MMCGGRIISRMRRQLQVLIKAIFTWLKYPSTSSI